jgi:hypothetical protein
MLLLILALGLVAVVAVYMYHSSIKVYHTLDLCRLGQAHAPVSCITATCMYLTLRPAPRSWAGGSGARVKKSKTQDTVTVLPMRGCMPSGLWKQVNWPDH